MKKDGFTLIEVIATLGILMILFLLVVPGYGMIRNNINIRMYENKIRLVKIAAENWAGDTGFTVTNISHLITEGKLEADNESGDYINPVDGSSMLCKVVRLKKENGNFISEVTEEENCDYNSLMLNNSMITLQQYDSNGAEILPNGVTNGWSATDVTLRIGFHRDFNYPDEVTKIVWKGNNTEKEVPVSKDFASKNSFVVEASQLLNTEYEVQVTFLHEGKAMTYVARSNVKIDKQRPTFYTDEILIDKNGEWTKGTKTLHFTMSDGSGSGIYGYSISKNNNCKNASYTKTNKQSITSNLAAGTYYLCIRDIARNISEDVSSHSVTISKIDSTGPNIQVTTSSSWGKENTATFTLKDTESGVSAYSFGSSSAAGEWIGINTTSTYTFTKNYNTNGTYYIYVQDAAGNINKTSFQIRYVDKVGPRITSASIASTTSYNGLSTKISLSAWDETSMQMCISNTGYEKDCSWESYTTSKNWTVSGTLNGGARTIYITLRDTSGNKTNRSLSYTVYKECGSNTSVSYSAWSGCSVTCGGGTKTRTKTTKDQTTGKVCSNLTESQTCNTQSCENPDDYDWSKDIACSATKFQQVINNGKFAEYIEHQQFRNAMYDCSSVTSDIIKNSSTAISAMKNSSRYELVSGKTGAEKGCTCYNREEDQPCWLREHNKSYACSEEYLYENAATVYDGKAFIFSASQYTEAKYPFFSNYIHPSWGHDKSSAPYYEEYAYLYIGDGALDATGNKTGNFEQQSAGSCTSNTTGESQCGNFCSSNECYYPLQFFSSKVKAALRTKKERDGTNSWYSRTYNFYDYQVYVQIFKI